MPLKFIATRRSFLKAGLVAPVSLSLVANAASVEAPTERLLLLSDTHIPALPELVWRSVNMTDNLKRAVEHICALGFRGVDVLINGDCAHIMGLPDDYKNLKNCLAPLRDIDAKLHLTLGNHDARDHIISEFRTDWELALPNEIDPDMNKLASQIDALGARWLILDSLDVVNQVTGRIGEAQLQWLKQRIATSELPVMVVVHHPPQFEVPAEGKAWSGLADTDTFWQVLRESEQVKGLLHGHIHTWERFERDGKTILSLPPTAYVFEPHQPAGYIEVNRVGTALEFKLHALDPSHRYHGWIERIELG